MHVVSQAHYKLLLHNIKNSTFLIFRGNSSNAYEEFNWIQKN